MSYFTRWFHATVTQSMPLTCTPPTSKKRKHTQAQDPAGPSKSPLPHFPQPPSPVPTLIIDEEQSVKVERCKEMGVKVRDFAEEKPVAQTPEVYQMAVYDLANWDAYLRKRHQRPFCERGLALGPTGGHGKVLRRLLAIGWITEEERKRNFQAYDIEALEIYDNSSSSKYPWRMPHGLEKPSPIDRRENWRSKFLPQDDDIPESEIFSSTPVTAEDEAEHRNKRVRNEEPPVPSTSSQPSLLPRPPLISHARRGALSRTKTMATLF